MKKFLLLVIAALPVLLPAQSRKEKKAKEKQDKLINASLREMIGYLASDQLEGRRTGTVGEQLAATYIAGKFEKAGLEPKGTKGFVQEFDIDEGKKAGSDNYFQVNNTKLIIKEDFFPLPFSPNVVVKGNASPGMQEMKEPWFVDIAEILQDNKTNPHFDATEALKVKAQKAAGKGATALLVYNSSSLVDNIQFNKFDTSAISKIPVLYISKAAFLKHFKDLTATYAIDILISISKEGRKAKNIVGYINNNATNTVVIGAHYDHLGRGEDGSTLDGNTEIHNGADDNASGTAALIELAGLLKQSKAKNNNYLFIAFSGEELGLRGSKYWLEHPSITMPVNYMINMDMVGRYDTSRKLTVGGYGTSPIWADVVTTANTEQLLIKTDSSGSGPSDHSSFYRKDIPVLFFFTNSHPDYW